jgi:hypothetical protein
MLLALVSLAAAMELRLSVTSPEGHVGTVTTSVSTDTVLTKFPLPITNPKKPSKQKYTALVSANLQGTVCKVDVEIYRGPVSRNKLVTRPQLVLTNYETSKVRSSAGPTPDSDVWEVSAVMAEDVQLDTSGFQSAVVPVQSAAPAPAAPAPAAPVEPATPPAAPPAPAAPAKP